MEIVPLAGIKTLLEVTINKIRCNIILKKWEICNQKVSKRLTTKGKRLAKG
jgi:hypothetical protein